MFILSFSLFHLSWAILVHHLWNCASSGGPSMEGLASDWTFGDCCWLQHLVAAPAAKITPLNKPKLLHTALLSAQSPVQVGCKKPTLKKIDKLGIMDQNVPTMLKACKDVLNLVWSSNSSFPFFSSFDR